MSELPTFQDFLSVGKSQAETQVVFEAETQAKIFVIELGPRGSKELSRYVQGLLDDGNHVVTAVETGYGATVST